MFHVVAGVASMASDRPHPGAGVDDRVRDVDRVVRGAHPHSTSTSAAHER